MKSASTLRILFVGGRKKGHVLLTELIHLGQTIVQCFILKEDRHEQETYSPALASVCNKHQIPCILSRKLTKYTTLIQKAAPDLIVVCGWRSIIHEKILNIPPLGAIAFHESLLPRYRGFAPINWAVINGEKQTGVTLFYLDSGIDSGDIISQKKIHLSTDITATELYEETISASVLLLRKYLTPILQKKAPRKKQDQTLATYACKRTPDDGRINWSQPSRRIYNLIRGLSYPYPGAFTYLNSRKLYIWKARMHRSKKYTGSIPGRIVSVNDRTVEVLTGDGSLLLSKIQAENSTVQPPKKLIPSLSTTLT